MEMMISGLLILLVSSQMELFRRVGQVTQAVKMLELDIHEIKNNLRELTERSK